MATTAEQDRRTAPQKDGRADEPWVGEGRRRLLTRRPVPGAIGSSRSARAVVAYRPTHLRPGAAVPGVPPAGLGVAQPGDMGRPASANGEPAGEGGRRAATHAARRALHAEAVELIRSEYATELRLVDVARRIGASPRALQRAFVDHGERSFSEELRARRLNVAAQLLRTTDLPVGEIARRVGYQDHAPFTKAFRRHHGTAPRAHRASSAPSAS